MKSKEIRKKKRQPGGRFVQANFFRIYIDANLFTNLYPGIPY